MLGLVVLGDYVEEIGDVVLRGECDAGGRSDDDSVLGVILVALDDFRQLLNLTPVVLLSVEVAGAWSSVGPAS